MKIILPLSFLVLSFFSCSSKKKLSFFDNWKEMKLGIRQSSSVETWNEQDFKNLAYRQIDVNSLKPVFRFFEEIDSTETPVWFDNMLGVVKLDNGDSLMLNLGFPSAIFRDVKSRKVYIIKEDAAAENWIKIVFGDLILK